MERSWLGSSGVDGSEELLANRLLMLVDVGLVETL